MDKQKQLQFKQVPHKCILEHMFTTIIGKVFKCSVCGKKVIERL